MRSGLHEGQMAAVYRDYDQAGLDGQYFLRGRIPDFQSFLDRYAARSKQARETLACKLDVAYGPSGPGETLDIFLPPEGRRPAPVHVFIHGGYWQMLDKADHSFVAAGLVPHGAAVVVVNYDLAPKVTIDEIVRQNRAALAWTWHNAASFGGDPGQIYVSGHSAGGHLTAMMASTDWPAFAPDLPRDLVKGGLMIAGLYDLEPIRLCYLNKVMGLTAAEVRRNSPINLDPQGGAKLALCVGAAETDEFLRQQQTYAAALLAKGFRPDSVPASGLHHFQVVEALAEPGTPLNRAALAQMCLPT